MRALPAGRAAGVIRVPGSKSAAIRALAVAALAPGRSTIHGGDLYEDTEAMLRVLEGFGVPAVAGESWEVNGGSLRAPEGPIDCGESGLSARIAMAMAATVDGETTITGRGRLLERPMAPLVEILRSQHIEVRASTGGTLPLTVNGREGWWGGEIVVPTDTSTQFLTAVLLAAPTARYPTAVRAVGDGGAIGYVGMTLDVMAGFGVRVIEAAQGFEVPNSGYRAGSYGVPPDASSAVYPAVAAAITGGEVTILGLDANDRQPDMEVFEHLRAMGCIVDAVDVGVRVIGPDGLDPIEADMEGAPDGALGLSVACLFARGNSRLTGLGSLRHKESDRLAAMAEGLGRLGARVEVTEDSISIDPPADAAAAVVAAHGDHRVAMSLALAGLRIEGVAVDHPEVVAKTWPGFWEDVERLVGAGSSR